MDRSQISSESYYASALAEDAKGQGPFNAQSSLFQSHESAVHIPCYAYDEGHAQTGRLILAGNDSSLVAPVNGRSYSMPTCLEHSHQPVQAAGDNFAENNTNLLNYTSSGQDISTPEVVYDFNTPIKQDKCVHTTHKGILERSPNTWACPNYRTLSDEAISCAPSGTISATMGLLSQSLGDLDREMLTAAHYGENASFSCRNDVASHVFTWLQEVPSSSVLGQPERESSEINNTESKSILGASDRDQANTSHDDGGRILNRWVRFEEWTSLDSSLASGHPFNALRRSIVSRAVDSFADWGVSRNGWHNVRRHTDYQEGEQASQSEVTFKRNEILEFACPYYKKSPSRYAECLKRCRLKTINDVKKHLWQNHRIPFYCPVCKREFPTASSRDQHIVKRLCVLEDIFPFEGVSDDQRRQLFRRHKSLGERQQWFQIWKLLLPKEPIPKSAYLNATHGLKVAMFREFWSLHGDTITSSAVREANLVDWGHRNEERDLACLYTEVLYGAIEQIMARLDIV